MSEAILAEPAATGKTASAGGLLRQAREQAGLHIGAMAVALKVPVKKIEALEADRVDLLPDTVFARALAGSICRHLKMDVTPVLVLLPQVNTDVMRVGQTRLDAPFQYGQGGSSLRMPEVLKNPVVWVAVVLVLAALVLYFWPAATAGSGNELVSVTSASGVQDAGVRPEVAVMPVAQMPLAVAADVQSVAAVASQSLASPQVQNTAPSPVVATGPVEMPKSADMGVSNPAGLVQFRAKGQSWIEVTDATGNVQLRKTLEAGELAGASGVMPLKVVVGRANLTTVQVRGQNFDLTALAKDNVARFEVR